MSLIKYLFPINKINLTDLFITLLLSLSLFGLIQYAVKNIAIYGYFPMSEEKLLAGYCIFFSLLFTLIGILLGRKNIFIIVSWVSLLTSSIWLFINQSIPLIIEYYRIFRNIFILFILLYLFIHFVVNILLYIAWKKRKIVTKEGIIFTIGITLLVIFEFSIVNFFGSL